MIEEQVFLCEACGSIMEFDAESQTLKCPHCGAYIEIEHHEERIVEHPLTLQERQKIKVKEKETKTIECQGCGAKLEVSQFDATAECPYCGSHYVLSSEQKDVLVPDGVVPFRVDETKLKELFQTWIKKRWFAPSELKRLYQRDKFLGVYVPYWTFDAKSNCSYTGRGGRFRTEHYKDSEGKEHTRTVTDWYYVSGRIEHFFDDVQIPATTRFKEGLFQGIQPFSFHELKSYSKEYLSGYLAENYSVDLESGHQEALNEMEGELRALAEQEILARYDCADSIHISPRFSKETYKYVLVPVYSTSYHYKNKQYTVVINGQSGRIKGEYPKSPVKIAIATIIAILAVIFGYMLISATSSTDSRAKEQQVMEMPNTIFEQMTGQVEIDNEHVVHESFLPLPVESGGEQREAFAISAIKEVIHK
ncbi:MAG TPA: hypothetical protein IAC14_00275 [Candidatus Scybalomonas excrementigallinarum]|nr:hypothetical protein [Candidatus Scybalomonas excrementigallinarum]